MQILSLLNPSRTWREIDGSGLAKGHDEEKDRRGHYDVHKNYKLLSKWHLCPEEPRQL
jgi:hypothetical protein